MKGYVLKFKATGGYVMHLDLDMDVVIRVAYVNCIERAMFIDEEDKEAVEEEFRSAIEDLNLEVIKVDRVTKEIL